MIQHHLDPATSILLVKPQSALDKNDFVEMARGRRPADRGPRRPRRADHRGAALSRLGQFRRARQHMRFIRDHEKHVKKIAVVTDSHLGDVAEHLTSHFVSAQIKHFPAGEVDQARAWITATS
jgi:hypothetical protein